MCNESLLISRKKIGEKYKIISGAQRRTDVTESLEMVIEDGNKRIQENKMQEDNKDQRESRDVADGKRAYNIYVNSEIGIRCKTIIKEIGL